MILQSMKNFFLQSFFLSIFMISISYAEVIKDVKVSGNVRISKETISVFGDIKLKENYDAKKINALTKRLYDTNFFSYIEVNLVNGVLQITVKENPIIQSLVFNGIKTQAFRESILEIIDLREKTSFVENTLNNDVQNIKTAFRNLGYYFVKVEAFARENNNNTIDLIYEIDLGKRAKIKKIEFIGDKKYRDNKLRSIITSEESRAWKVISSKKYLNYERIDLDVRLLENFYKSKGHYLVKVLSTNVIYEQEDGFLLTYNIEAGPKFKVGEISLNFAQGINKDYFSDIKKDMSKLRNKYYSPARIKRILDNINKFLNTIAYKIKQ